MVYIAINERTLKGKNLISFLKSLAIKDDFVNFIDDEPGLFYSIDNGRIYTTIVTGVPGTETSYVWTVPNTNSDSCKIKIIFE